MERSGVEAADDGRSAAPSSLVALSVEEAEEEKAADEVQQCEPAEVCGHGNPGVLHHRTPAGGEEEEEEEGTGRVVGPRKKEEGVVEEEEEEDIREVVRRIGLVELKRTEEEVERVAMKLEANWVTSLAQWHALAPDKKRELHLPLMLVHRLDEEAAAAGPDSDIEPAASSGQLQQQQLQREEETEDQLDETDEEEDQDGDEGVAKVDRTATSIKCTIEGVLYEFDKDEPLSTLLKQLGAGKSCPCRLYGQKDSSQIPRRCKLSLALVPGSKLVIGERSFLIKPAYRENAVDVWLRQLSLERYSNTFAHFGVDDFFALPFLNTRSLQGMGIDSDPEAMGIISRAVHRIVQADPFSFVGMWLDCLGLGVHAPKFAEEIVTLDNLRFMEEADCRNLGIVDPREVKIIIREIERYKRFSSVEETFTWLRANGFEKYSFHFSRYNIPYYALPFVNFFIIDEMGVTHDDQILLQALQLLKTSPCYCTKAMTYWLRDLEMEHHNLTFAKKGLTDLEDLILLLDQDVDALIGEGVDSTKMKDALKEMKEFQYYYSATASLLQELGIERYAQLFALHGISVDMLSLLRDDQLIEMGITDPSDRRKILTAVQKINDNLPTGMATWLKEYDKGLIEAQQQARPMIHPPMKTNVGARGDRRATKKNRDRRNKKKMATPSINSRSRSGNS